ncbi:MAG: hypothetical protein M0Q23_07200 [Syntrophales bacterium]|nr:hypothetical protein [Syntrophales bacterium]MCK9528410.1 hypothetical protein [Syntrophales bacterium]MDX9922433.1 hypothetical protein [Syntrophales bacterium]
MKENMRDLTIRAGSNIYEMIRDGELTFDHVSTVVGPAVGPRWFLASGFDLALLKAGVLGTRHPVTLAGSSAGALRFAAWVQPESVAAYEHLIDSYIRMTFTREDTPTSIRKALADVIDSFVEDDALHSALAHSTFRIAITTALARHVTSSETRLFQASGILAAGILNIASSSLLSLFFDPTVFYSGYTPPPFCLKPDFTGTSIPLNEANFKPALLASSAVPLAVSGVRNIYGAPHGVYRDGGLVDYHGNMDYAKNNKDVVLLFHHQERQIPAWLDRYTPWRSLPESWTANLLVVSPTKEFVERLPEGRIPDRRDFRIFAGDPSTRIKQWRRVVAESSILGEMFLECVTGGKAGGVVTRI